MNILGTNEEFRQVARVDEDPAVLLLDIAAGNEELNTEFFRHDIISKAETALTKSIDLDTQIEANGIVSKGTVAYGIEALDMAATFLGVDFNAEAVAAGIEDDDQESPKEEKKGFLAKVRDAASKVWQSIMEIIHKITNKVKDFFSSKAVEKAEKDLDEAAEKVEKETGSADAKPKCRENQLERHALAIAGVEPAFVLENGIKSSKDFNTLFDFVLDKEAFKNIQQFGKVLSKDFKQYIDDLNTILSDARKRTKKSTIRDAIQAIFATGDGVKETTKIRNTIQKAGVDFIKSFTIKDFKQHPLKEKLIKDNEKNIIKTAKLSTISGLEYNILYTGASLQRTGKGKHYIQMDTIVVYKDNSAIQRFENAANNMNNMQSFESALHILNTAVGVKIVKTPIMVKPSEFVKMVEPMSSKELREIRHDLADLPAYVTKAAEDIDSVINTSTKEVHNLQNDLNNLGTIGNSIYTVINGIATAIAAEARGSINGAPNLFTRLVNAEINFSSRCGEDTKPFGG